LPAIVVEDLVKSYPRGLGARTVALAGVSLTIEPGETVGIIGPNGAGKTTLLGCLLGFLRPDSGRIAIDGHEVDDLAVRAATGYLPERLVLDRWMSGRALLDYHHALAGLPAQSRASDCEALLGRVGLDREAADRRVGRYSRGMLQRLALRRRCSASRGSSTSTNPSRAWTPRASSCSARSSRTCPPPAQRS
jgi:ABC-2 type transport system ATP-binding protein